jgi:hypothetical protein
MGEMEWLGSALDIAQVGRELLLTGLAALSVIIAWRRVRRREETIKRPGRFWWSVSSITKP